MSQTNVVEPLQAILTLCVLAYMPVGSRVCIRNFQLLPDSANAYQGILRWWFSDTRESMHCLFNAIRRFNQWEQMYDLTAETVAALRRNAYRGVTSLQTTYMQTERSRGSQVRSDVYVLDMLTMYQKLILNPNHAGTSILNTNHAGTVPPSFASIAAKPAPANSAPEAQENESGSNGSDDHDHRSDKKKSVPKNRASATSSLSDSASVAELDSNRSVRAQDLHSSSAARIDAVFCKITKVYSQAEKQLIFSFLSFLEQPELSQNDTLNILSSLEYARKPMLAKTDAWIAQNMVAI